VRKVVSLVRPLCQSKNVNIFFSSSMGRSGGTNAAVIRGALRAERPELLTVILPQSRSKQPPDIQDILSKVIIICILFRVHVNTEYLYQVENVVDFPSRDELTLSMAARLCNSEILSRAEALIAIAFHDSKNIIEATNEARGLNLIVTTLFLD